MSWSRASLPRLLPLALGAGRAPRDVAVLDRAGEAVRRVAASPPERAVDVGAAAGLAVRAEAGADHRERRVAVRETLHESQQADHAVSVPDHCQTRVVPGEVVDPEKGAESGEHPGKVIPS